MGFGRRADGTPCGSARTPPPRPLQNEKYPFMPSNILATATEARINPMTRLMMLAPLLPIIL